MKVYNKKGFLGGLFWLVMGILWLVLFYFQDQGLNLRNIFFCACALLIGAEQIVRSLSRNLSDADQDERAKYVLTKSRSSAFFWSKVLCLLGGLIYLGVFQLLKEELYVGIFVGFMLMLIVMFVVQAITEIYYDMRV